MLSVDHVHRQTQRRLKLALSATSDAIWEWNLVTNQTYYSPRWYEMLGYGDRQFEMSFEAWKELCHPDDFQPTVDSIQAALEHPESGGYTAEFRMRRTDGAWVWILGRGTVVERDDQGKPLMLSGTNTDITERKRAEATLAESEGRLRFLADNLPTVMLCQTVVSASGDRRFTYVSGGVALAHGLTPEQVYADPTCLFEQIHEDDAVRFAAAQEETLRSPLTSIEVRTRHPDGRVRWVLIRAAAHAGQNGDRIVDSVEIDITELKDAQERAANAQLARQREVLEHFFTLSLDLMCIAGVDGYFRRVSPAFDVLGHSREELLSRPFLDFVHPEDLAATRAEVDKLAHGIPSIHFENRYRCKDGSYRWLAWCTAPDPSGTLYAIARDVSETKHAQDELARAKDAAEAANRELESFSYSVAHDLRAPLRSIDGFSLALLEDYADKLDAEGKQYLSFVRESAQHMEQLIADLLALSQVTRSELHRERVDLSALARATVARLQRSQPDRRVEVVIEEGVTSDGDARLLKVALDNLLGNAWKFTGHREQARIELGATSKDGHPVYFVRDNGAGFDMAFVNKLFGVFQRLHSSSEFEGTGVGLATVQRVVCRQGGRVWGEGEVDRGAAFYFTLHENEHGA